MLARMNALRVAGSMIATQLRGLESHRAVFCKLRPQNKARKGLTQFIAIVGTEL
jgi:hypothetical protein